MAPSTNAMRLHNERGGDPRPPSDDHTPPWLDKGNPQREFERLDRFLDMERHAEKSYARAMTRLATSRSKKVRAKLQQQVEAARTEYRDAQKLKARTPRPGHFPRY